MTPKVPVLLAALGLLVVACPNGATLDNPERFEPPQGDCDAPKDVFEVSCGNPRCHEGKSELEKPDGWVDLFLPGLEERLVSGENEFAEYPDLDGAGCPSTPERMVDLANPDESLLMKKLLGTQSCGDPMPPAPADPLTAGDIACVRSWISSLAQGSQGGAAGASGLGGSL